MEKISVILGELNDAVRNVCIKDLRDKDLYPLIDSIVKKHNLEYYKYPMGNQDASIITHNQVVLFEKNETFQAVDQFKYSEELFGEDVSDKTTVEAASMAVNYKLKRLNMQRDVLNELISKLESKRSYLRRSIK